MRNQETTVPSMGLRGCKAKEENSLGKKLQATRRAHKMTLEDLCIRLAAHGVEIGRASVSKWESGLTIPNAYQLLVLCDIYRIEEPVAYFTGKQELNDIGLRKVAEYRSDLIATGLYEPAPSKNIRYIQMPVSLLSASAGTGNFLDEENFEQISFPANAVPSDADFGIRVCGDSMEPVYSDGQIVWVRRCTALRPGEVGIFTYDGCGYIKLYNEEQPENADAYTDSDGVVHAQPVLISYNKKYQPIRVSQETGFCVIGKVL